MTPFDDAVALTLQPDGSWLGRTSPAYANMVGPFGGMTAAVLLNAAVSHRERAGEPLALTVNFAAPVADGSFSVRARIARNNRSTQHWSLELVQGDEIVATGTSVFAVRRETWSALEAKMPSGLPRPADLPRMPLHGRPPWVHRYDMRFVHGAMPAFDEAEQHDSSSCLWIRDDPPRPLDFLSLAAICDNFFPRVFVRRRKRSPVGTVSMTIYFHASEAVLAEQANRFVLGVARALNFRNGFFDQSAEIWGDGGELFASTHQVVYYRD
jgi:acyl-CoA thioesterase